MRFGLLGPLLVADDAAREIPVPAARQRAVLAALLVRANRTVSVDELAELVWDGAPPGGAGHTLRAYVMRLRHLLGEPIAARIVTRDPGYLIRVEAPELDALQFETLCQQAGRQLRAGAWAEASAAASGALELWRGEPLLDVSSSLLREQFTARLDDLRVQVLEDRAEADLHLGRHDRLVPQLRELTAAHPLRERFHAQLMLALARAGRQAEALEAFREARRVLVEQLGVEPGRQLQDLHQRLLRGEPVSPPPPDLRTGSQPTVARAPTTAPRQLPAAARHFTGRQTELGDLLALMRRSEPASSAAAGGTVVISAIDGMAGIGKTALAVRAAHALAERFPGGQLFIDLHGYTKGRPPREPGEALEVLLRTLGVSTQRIPADVEERAALYRERLAELSTLIVLDNAADEAQVRPLLPGHAGCLVLVTSRRKLKGLDDAYSLSLDLLPPVDAVALLRAVAGPGRIPVNDPLLGQVAELCGNLPLALRIVGALLRHRPAWDLGHLAGLLRDQHRRVQALFDGERDLGAVFDLSYSSLDEQHRLLFRRLGLVPGTDSDAYAAAALLEADIATVTALLEDLVDHNLLIEHAPGRYRLHDLIRVHARALADKDPNADTLDRLLHFYGYTSQSASILIARHPRPAPDGPCPAHGPALPHSEAARAWLRAERDNLEAACTQARALALHDHALALTAGLAEIMRTDGPFARALVLHQAAADCAAREGRLAAHATALTDLGIALRLAGDLPGAGDSLTAALEIHRAAGNRHGEATALTELALIRQVTGDVPGADEALTQALEIYGENPHRGGEATALANLGLVRYLAGNLLGAADPLARAQELYRAIGNRLGEANAMLNLGRVQLLTGGTVEAAEAFRIALEIYRESGHRSGEADALTDLGIVRRMAGDLPGAFETIALALDFYRAIGNRQGEANALAELGLARHQAGDLAGAGEAITRALEIFRDTGNRSDEAWVLNHHAANVAATDLPRALSLYREALAMNRELDKPDGEAVALEGLGECHLSAGGHELGTAYLRQALEIYQRLGLTPDAERVRARLSTVA